MPGDERVAHAPEQVAEHLRLGVRELHELEAVGAGGVPLRDGGGGGVVREGSHEAASERERAGRESPIVPILARGARARRAKFVGLGRFGAIPSQGEAGWRERRAGSTERTRGCWPSSSATPR
jgi:hypothetical protein